MYVTLRVSNVYRCHSVCHTLYVTLCKSHSICHMHTLYLGILVCERPLVVNLDILAQKRTLLAILGRIVHEHFWVSDLGILVCEHPLVVNFG